MYLITSFNFQIHMLCNVGGLYFFNYFYINKISAYCFCILKGNKTKKISIIFVYRSQTAKERSKIFLTECFDVPLIAKLLNEQIQIFFFIFSLYLFRYLRWIDFFQNFACVLTFITTIFEFERLWLYVFFPNTYI